MSTPSTLRAGRRTNLALLAMLVSALVTGVLGYAIGTPGTARVVTIAHGAFGFGLLLLVPWKSVIVRRSIGRSTQHHTASILLGLLLLTSLAAGVLHAVGGYHSVLGFTALTVHVAAAVLIVPLLVAHARGRRQQLRRADLTRRTVLRAGALGVGSLATYGTVEAANAVLRLPGRHRRATGSYEIGSGVPEQMPVTQWFTDRVPTVDRLGWQAEIGPRTVTYAELSTSPDGVRAVLDCTGGWYAEQDWRGVRLDRLLTDAPADTQSFDVVSVTGYRRRFALADADRLLLATHVAGSPLSDGHGGPVRLVAPGRRGYWWVKWVRRVELTSRPAWLQPPFPLQ